MVLLCFLIGLLFIMTFIVLYQQYKEKEGFAYSPEQSWDDLYENERIKIQEPIYCLMVTGKDNTRIQLAVESAKNFLHQDYRKKILVIVNHHPSLKVLDILTRKTDVPKGMIYEFSYKKRKDVFLGDLRNFALSLVPYRHLWLLWDDDDWRRKDFMTVLYTQMVLNKAEAIAFTKRYEFNVLTRFSWMMELKSGFPVLLCRQNPLLRYLRKDTMEDVELIPLLKKLNILYVYSNDPRLYIRVVHGENTSKYVDRKKDKVIKSPAHANYREYDIKSEEKMFINNNINDDILYAKEE